MFGYSVSGNSIRRPEGSSAKDILSFTFRSRSSYFGPSASTSGRLHPNIEVLVKEAEERHDAHQAAALSHPVSQNINLTTVRQYGNQPTASTTTDNDTPTAGHFICWYHRRYDDNARKCSQGCQYQSKNCIIGCV